MKKKYYYLIIFVLLIIVLFLIFFKKEDNKEVICKEFSTKEYNNFIDEKISEKTYKIGNCTELKRESEKIMMEVFGEEIKKQKPFNYYYDYETHFWLITGTTKKGQNGGGKAHIIINNDGKIIAKWKEK